MARKGKFGKKPDGKEGPKQDRAKAKGPPTDKVRDGEAVKKGAGKGDVKRGAGQLIANLGGFIFMCNSSTKPDCFKYRVFGLNEGKKNLVEQVRKGMRLFLFDTELRLLYGIYTAASNGTFKLEPDAFRGAFPWQVRFSIQKDCLPLSEDIFRAAIKDNYMDKKKFKVELTTEQVHRLVKLFRPLPGGPGRSPPCPRLPAPDYFEDAPKPKPPRFPEARNYEQDRPLLGHLPRPKYEANYASSDRFIAEKQSPYAQSLTKYAHLYPSEERRVLEGQPQGIAARANRESIYAADDLYLGRELRLQQGLTHTNSMGIGSLVPGHSLASASFSAYSADSLRPLSDLRLPRIRDDIYSQGSTFGADVDPIYRSRLQVPDLRGDILDRRGDILDRRVSALDPLAESLAYTGGLSGDVLRGSGLSGDVSRGRPLNDAYASGYGALPRYESSASLLSGIPGASGLSYRSELLPQSRFGGF